MIAICQSVSISSPYRSVIRTGILGLALIALTSPHQARAGSWLTELRSYDERAEAIGHRLATAASPYCRLTIPTLGISLDAIDRYELSDRSRAKQELGLTDDLQLSAVVAGGPAERAGLRARDALVAINRKPLPTDLSKLSSDARVLEARTMVERLSPTDFKELTVRRGGSIIIVNVIPDAVCDFHLVLSTRSDAATFTDGHDIDVSAELFRTSESDDEVAFAAAHEAAHVIFNQYRKSPQTLIERRRTELNADKLGIALMTIARFDPEGAVRFWTKFKSKDLFGFLRSRSHPSVRARLAEVEKLVLDLRTGTKALDLIDQAMCDEQVECAMKQ